MRQMHEQHDVRLYGAEDDYTLVRNCRG